MQNADLRHSMSVLNDENEKFAACKVSEVAASYVAKPNGKDAAIVLTYLASRIHGDVAAVLDHAAALIGKYYPEESESQEDEQETQVKKATGKRK